MGGPNLPVVRCYARKPSCLILGEPPKVGYKWLYQSLGFSKAACVLDWLQQHLSDNGWPFSTYCGQYCLWINTGRRDSMGLEMRNEAVWNCPVKGQRNYESCATFHNKSCLLAAPVRTLERFTQQWHKYFALFEFCHDPLFPLFRHPQVVMREK